MQEKIVEILIYVLNELRRTNKPIGEIDVKTLEGKGYTPVEINAAFNWLVERIAQVGSKPSSEVPQSSSFRVLNNAEKLAISSEAYGYLMQLRELNIITTAELEFIIERSLMSGFERLDIFEMQSVVASILFESEMRNASQGKIVVNSNDTIN
jgi:uncharacterized protein Smg (DUF494 family)